MSEIVGIGANVCDTLFSLPHYPAEDTKQRAESVLQSGGGPCATGLVAASKLGAKCAYLGNLTDDHAGQFLLEDMKKYGVSCNLAKVLKGYSSFISCIWLSKDRASRTCVFHKGTVPPLVLDEEQKAAIIKAKILMVDGNEMEAAIRGAKIAKERGTKVLYDAGGLYEGVERLLPYADILIPSEEFALGHTKAASAEEAAKILFDTYAPEVVVITQGKKGGILYDGTIVEEYPAFSVDAVDSNGSGDVFHGAYAFAVTRGMEYKNACVFSSAVSALKCTKIGARTGAPTFDQVMDFLKECNIKI